MIFKLQMVSKFLVDLKLYLSITSTIEFFACVFHLNVHACANNAEMVTLILLRHVPILFMLVALICCHSF